MYRKYPWTLANLLIQYSPFPEVLMNSEMISANGSFHAASSAHISVAVSCHQDQIEPAFVNAAHLLFCTLSTPIHTILSFQTAI